MKPVNVTQLNRYIKTALEHDPLLTNISVVGEVSNLKYHSSGHIYFSLKDSTSTIRCFVPESRATYMDFLLEEGMKITASGYIYLYEKGGYYSLNIRDIRPDGEGAMAAAFEKLKKKLGGEGLFDPERKKPIPLFPRTVGICTSQTGAAVWDMIRTIKNKNNYCDIIICPCSVQGEGAAADIAKAIKAMENRPVPPDVLIVGRGGGSMEDLWAFNEEITARAIADCRIPVISAVGHETDFTIADFVADMRAATPTAAAEAAVPDIVGLETEMAFMIQEAENRIKNRLKSAESRVEVFSPEGLVRMLTNKVLLLENRCDSHIKTAEALLSARIQREEARVEKLMAGAEAMNPYHILGRGYAAVTDSEGRLVKSAAQTGKGDRLRIRLSDGTINAEVTE